MAHQCTLCNKTFANLCWLKRHERRKTPCAVIVEPRPIQDDMAKAKFPCKYCNRTYASNATMRRHIRETCTIAPTVKNGNAGMDLLYERTLQQKHEALQRQVDSLALQLKQQQVDDLKAQNADMQAIIMHMHSLSVPALMPALMPEGVPAIMPTPSPTVGSVVTTNTTLAAGEVGLIQCDYNNIATDKSVAFNLFGKESLAHANSDRIRAILDDSLSSTSSIQAAARMAVTKTAMLIYSDPDHPENLTCYMPNKKTNDVLTHTERGWEIYPVSVVINMIGQTTIDHIFAKQPFENADHYTLIMKELQKNEYAYISDSLIRPILIRNRSLLYGSLGTLPTVGMP